MSIKCRVACAASLLVLAGAFGPRAQESHGGWDPPLETRAVLTIRDTTTGSGSVELRGDEYVSLVVTPGFRGADDLCVSSMQFGVARANLEHGDAAWLIEARLVELGQDEATIDLRWTRRINRADLTPADSVTSEQRVVLREGEVRMLDLIRTRQPVTGCANFGLTYELRLEGPRALAGAAIAYDLWLVQQDADGELVTDRYQVTARQGQQVDYFFRPVGYTADARRTTGAAAILLNVSGTVRGRVRSDGDIDLTVDGSRGFSNAAATAAVWSRGRTLLTVRPGETIEVSTNLPVGGSLSDSRDLNQLFGQHRTAVRITAKRLW